MAKRTLTDRLVAGWAPSPPPAKGADGGPVFSGAHEDAPRAAPIPICELGPCVNYHLLVAKLDAQEPLALAQGESAAITVQTVRTCYPAPGIEIDISSDPPRECSLWTPLDLNARLVREGRRQEYVNRHLDEVAAFQSSWGLSDDDNDTTDKE